MSPDNTSDGWLKKKWIIADNKRMLVKGGSGTVQQEPFNEALATAIARRLNIPHAPYTVIYEGGKPLSVCEDFITRDTDLVSAWHIIGAAKQRGSISQYQHFIDCCKTLGIPNAVQSIDQMLALDFLLCNQDRHYNNFGAVRNANTLEWLGLAPIYDCGTSMWYDVPAHMIKARGDSESKPFRKTHFEQIKLATDLSWIDIPALRGIDDEFMEIMRLSEYMDEQRRNILCDALNTRVKLLESLLTAWEREPMSTG
ncbi:MAG: HipA domain-containing protein [Clostridiales bacterium]|nr:HipA domain-containing protein [Clostridiales bacterium]